MAPFYSFTPGKTRGYPIKESFQNLLLEEFPGFSGNPNLGTKNFPKPPLLGNFEGSKSSTSIPTGLTLIPTSTDWMEVVVPNLRQPL